MEKPPRRVGVEIGLPNGGLGVGGSRVSRSNAANRIFIIECPAAKLFHAAWMNAVILPVSVSAKDQYIFDLFVGEVLKKRVCFVPKTVGVRVVIAFAGTIGSDERGRGEDDFPFGRT